MAISFGDLWNTYVSSVASASNEDSLKQPLQNLVEGTAGLLGLDIATGTEDTEAVVGARPDVNVYQSKPLRMHLAAIELKKPKKALPGGEGYRGKAAGLVGRWDFGSEQRVDGAKPDKREHKQWDAMSQLPNLLYCNGIMIARYDNGVLVDSSDTEALAFASNDDDGIPPADISLETIKRDFLRILTDALGWEPPPPRTMKEMAVRLAPLTRTLRGDILAALNEGNSGAMQSAKEAWATVLITDASDADFADGYAQAAVFAFLFARLDGAPTPLTLDTIKTTIREDHTLLFGVIETLMRSQTRDLIRNALDNVIRYITVVDPVTLTMRKENPWHDFYEFFIAEYDPARRNDMGVYFTPREVVEFQVQHIHEQLLEMGFEDSFATEGVKVVDPATGSGTYLLAVIDRTRRFLAGRGLPGIDDDPIYAARLAENLFGIEIGVGAYSIAQLRIGRALADMADGDAPPVNVYLSDTLTDPWGKAQQKMFMPELADEQEKANRLKAAKNVTVILGNPPYDRQEGADENYAKHGGWVRHEARGEHAEAGDSSKPLFDDFRDAATERGHGKEAAKALPNLYLYFWRWAIWKAFEQHSGPGIVSFINPVGFLTGVGTEAVRRHMRMNADEIVTFDLLGDRRGARRTYNIFTEIQTATGITTMIRYKTEKGGSGAAPWTRRVFRGDVSERLQQLAGHTVSGVTKEARRDQSPPAADVFSDVIPTEVESFTKHIPLTNIFPLHRSGVKAQRMWVYAETERLAKQRWKLLLETHAEIPERLGEDAGTKASNKTSSGLVTPGPQHALVETTKDEQPEAGFPRSQYRPFDIHTLAADKRVLGRPSPDLWSTAGDHQVYFVSRFVATGCGTGPLALMTDAIPDLDCANPANGGGADVAPLFKGADESKPNINESVMEALSDAYDQPISAEQIMFYCNGFVGTGAYTATFWDELEFSVPRVIFPGELEVFLETEQLGRHVAWLHTDGRVGQPASKLDVGDHPIETSAPSKRTASGMPPGWSYDAGNLRVEGKVHFSSVTQEVMDFQFMGKRVIESWLDYRKDKRKAGARAKLTPLDDLRPDWGPEMSKTLLSILIAINHYLKAEAIAQGLIDRTLKEPLSIAVSAPSKAERKPVSSKPEDPQISLIT